MDGGKALLDAKARDARVDVLGALRWRDFDFVRGVGIRCLELRAMHFRLPLQVGIFVHFVGPDGRVQLEAAGDGNDFLAVGHAARGHDAGYRNALGAAKVGGGQFGAALRAGGLL